MPMKLLETIGTTGFADERYYLNSLVMQRGADDTPKKVEADSPVKNVRSGTKGWAYVCAFTEDEGGLAEGLVSGRKFLFFFGSSEVEGTILVDNGLVVAPGMEAEIRFELDKALGIEEGARFGLKDGDNTIGVGMVTEIG